MPANHRVVSALPYTYLDQTGAVVDGYKVHFTMTEFDETHFVLVPNLNPETVKREIAALIQDRKNIATD